MAHHCSNCSSAVTNDLGDDGMVHDQGTTLLRGDRIRDRQPRVVGPRVVVDGPRDEIRGVVDPAPSVRGSRSRSEWSAFEYDRPT